MFTKNQIQEIGRKLGLLGKKDTDFEDAKLPLSGEEYIVLVQNGKNVKTKVKNLGGNFQPDDPNDPENPGEPSDPDTPDIPDVPDEPDIPDTPDDPDVPTYDPPKLYVIPKTWNVESTGGTLEVHLDPRNADESTLSVISIADDIRCERLSTTRIFNVTMPENKTGNIRYETITFSVVGLDGTTAEATLNIEQKASNTEITSNVTLNKVPTFAWDAVNVEQYFTGTFENCVPLRGVSTENYSITYEGLVTGNIHKFKVSLLKINYSIAKTYSGKIEYQNIDGTVGSVYAKINVESAPSASITLSPRTLNFPYTGGSVTVGVGIQNAYPNAVLNVTNNHPGFITVKEVTTNTYLITASPNDRVTEKGGDINFSIKGLNGLNVVDVLTVKIAAKPTSEDEEPDTEQLNMYRGYLDLNIIEDFNLLRNGTGREIYKLIDQEVIDEAITRGLVVKEPLTTKNNIPFDDMNEGNILLFAIPVSSSLKVYKDDGWGEAIPFNATILYNGNTLDFFTNGDIEVLLKGGTYKLYGEIQTIPIIDGSLSYYIK